MSEHPVFVFGAGATAACGGPQTSQLLPAVFDMLATYESDLADDAAGRQLESFASFVKDCFHVEVDEHWRVAEGAVFPSVPLLLSLIDVATDRGQPIGQWPVEQMAGLRSAAQTALLGVIEAVLSKNDVRSNPYERLLAPLYRGGDRTGPVALSLNYDAILDKTMFRLGSASQRRIPDYGCDLIVENANPEKYGRLLKLHGSLNWVHCRRCNRLSLHMSGLAETKGFWEEFGDVFEDMRLLMVLTEPENASCPRCQGRLGPLIITPSLLKDYRNPHVSRIWYEAEQTLRSADKVVFVGYSLPWDDVEVVYLLKQSLEHLPPDRITVVEFSKEPVSMREHEAGQRYLSLFGKGIQWSSMGFDGWLNECDQMGVSPLD